LIPGHITLRSELNEVEQAGVLATDVAILRRVPRNLFDERLIQRLHRQMFGEVWRWAGTYRTTERNIGVDPSEIRPAMRVLMDDARYWVAHDTCLRDELAVRFGHRLVPIHPFPNGNGRISRLMADLIVVRLGGERFTWGQATIPKGETRSRYIAAAHHGCSVVTRSTPSSSPRCSHGWCPRDVATARRAGPESADGLDELKRIQSTDVVLPTEAGLRKLG